MSLILCTFFNPFGFDALFALVMKWTGSYWTTDIIFYCVSFLFFVIYVLLSPETKSKIIRYKSKLKNIYM
jgi:glucose-6-phosphate-specific signal transduction histidine kinase